MSFFMMPTSAAATFQQQIPSSVSYPFGYETNASYPYFVNRTVPNQVAYPTRVERNVPFKVYVFDRKFDQRTQLSSASNILRFEIDSNSGRSFELFDRVLREHSVDLKGYNLYYIDDEHDLVALSTERDFQFMIKLMKGQLTKVICEKKVTIPQQATIRVSQVPQPSCFFGQCPQFRANKKVENDIESMIDKAFRSAFPIEENQRFFPKVSSPQPHQPSQARKEAPRRIEITLSDLFGIPKQNEPVQKTEKKEQPREEKKDAQSFREFLIQRLKERYPAEPKKEEAHEKKEETPNIETPKEDTAVTQPTIENPETTNVETPNMTTSLLLSNNISEEPKEEHQDVEPIQTEPSKQDLENQDPIIESIVDEEEKVVTSIPHKYQKELKYLNDMGFSNHVLNVTLLNKYSGDLESTISDLIHQ